VRPEVNGWLVAPDDAGALAGALADALGEPARLERMGASSRRIVETEFAWEILIDRYLRLYDELLAGRPRE
jgi:glycosyltransferase involved in cell wall biosynthesis